VITNTVQRTYILFRSIGWNMHANLVIDGSPLLLLRVSLHHIIFVRTCVLGTLDHASCDDAAWGGGNKGKIKVNANRNLAASNLIFLPMLPSLPRHAAHSISFSKTYSRPALHCKLHCDIYMPSISLPQYKS
jgi:hypothetical protein